MSRTLRSTPLGLGGVGLSNKGSIPGVPGLKASSLSAAPSAKGRNAVITNALPFLELSIAIGDGLSNFKSSMDEEMVLQATLQVPAHHALSCRVQAYGTPFAAPDLHTLELTDADLEFATCMAAPPDIEEQPSFSLTRMASLLERNTLVTPHRDAAAGGAAAARVSPSAAALQQTPAMKAAPKVLISVDDDQTPLPLSRSESLRSKQRKLLMAAGDTARRTLGTLLGVGVLLQQLHESAVRQLQQHLQAPSARARSKRLAAARQLAPVVAGLAAGGAPLTSMDDGNEQLWGPHKAAAVAAAGSVAGPSTSEPWSPLAQGRLAAAAAASASTPAGPLPEVVGAGSPVWGLSRAAQAAPEQLSSFADVAAARAADEANGPSTPEPIQQQQQRGSNVNSSSSSSPGVQAAVTAGAARGSKAVPSSAGELLSSPSLVVQTFLHTPTRDGACSKVCLSPGNSTIASHRVLQTAASIRMAGLEPVTPRTSHNMPFPSWWEPAAAAALAAAEADTSTAAPLRPSVDTRGAGKAGASAAAAGGPVPTTKEAAVAVAADGVSVLQGACDLLAPTQMSPGAAAAAAASAESEATAAFAAPVSSFSAAASVPLSAEGSDAAERHARAVGHWQRPVRRLLSIQLVCHPSLQRPVGTEGGKDSPICWSLVSPVA